LFDKKLPYVLKPSLLTPRELKFYKSLAPLAGQNNLIISIKPRIADFINVTVKQYEKNSGFYTHFNRISAKHIDFLLLDDTTKPIVGFELDDTTHNQPNRIKRDNFVDDVYHTVGLNVFHINTYSSEFIETMILESLHQAHVTTIRNTL